MDGNRKDIHTSKNKFILFEGTDGSGKTSLAKKMAESTGSIYYYNPPEVLRSLRNFADESLPHIRYQYYLLGNHIAAEEIKELLKTGHVICDWYIFSTIAYHSILLNKELTLPDIFMPDKIIFVSAEWNEIEKRLNARESTSKYEDLEFLKNVYEQYVRILSPLSNVLKMDTTGKDSEHVVSEILEKKVL